MTLSNDKKPVQDTLFDSHATELSGQGQTSDHALPPARDEQDISTSLATGGVNEPVKQDKGSGKKQISSQSEGMRDTLPDRKTRDRNPAIGGHLPSDKPRRKPTESQRPAEDRDLHLKLLTKHLLSAMGYYTEIQVNVFTYSYTPDFKRENVSDLDVYGIQFESDFNPREVIVECKSTDEHALDELLKLRGILELRKTARAILVKHRIALNAREVGHKVGVRTLDASELGLLMEHQSLMSPQLLPSLLANYRSRQAVVAQAKADFTKAMNYLTVEYWNVDHNRNIQSLIALLVQLRPKLHLELRVHKFLFLETVKLLSVSLLHLCRYVTDISLSEPVPRIKDYMFGGARERREREILFDRINQQLGQSASFYPSYLQDLEELTVWLLRSPEAARQVPLCLDHVINSSVLALKGYEVTDLPAKFDRVTLKLAKDVLVFALKESGASSEAFRDFLQL